MQYSIFKAPALSFYSKGFYNDTALSGKGTGLLYLFLILLICYPLSLLAGYLHFLPSLDSAEMTEITSKLPDMTVKEGILSINKPSPYRMEFRNATTQEKTVIVFDTSGNSKLPEDAKALVADKGIVMDSQSGLVPWSQISPNFEFRANKFKDKMSGLMLSIAGFASLLLPLVWVGHAMLALVYAVVGLIMDRNKLGFATAMRMAIVAMTPGMVLTTFFYLIFGTPSMFAFLLLWELITIPVTLGYLFFGYSSVQQ